MTETKSFPVEDYDLAATLTSGQAFRWKRSRNAWEGVIGSRWVRLELNGQSLVAETVRPAADWRWLTDYLQIEVNLRDIIQTFPSDPPLQEAVRACRGLRVLRQDPWECLASFILSSTKQIVQIQQIIKAICEAFGDPIRTPPGYPACRSFPSPVRLSEASEAELRSCKMGFRAPYLLGSARMVASRALDLERLNQCSVDAAREQLMTLPGVGRKIADCVLLFAYGFQSAFPVDVWVMRALQELYFPRRKVNLKHLHQFSREYFGAYAGYAQQYLFHYIRTREATRRAPARRSGRLSSSNSGPAS